MGVSFQGLSKMQLGRTVVQTVKQGVAGWAENPDFIRSAIGEGTPGSASLKLWSMSNVQDAGFSARVTRSRQSRIPPSQSDQVAVLTSSLFLVRMVLSKFVRIALIKLATGFSCRFVRTVQRAMTVIGFQPRKLFAALSAKSSRVNRDFSASSPPDFFSASMRTVAMPRSLSIKCQSALVAMFDALFSHKRILINVE